MKKLYILAPSDRFNYGDIIFPHIVNYYFKDYFDNIIFCSTSQSNLSKKGGIPTKSIQAIYGAHNTDENHLIVAGGDTLCIDWQTILSFIDKKTNYLSAIDNKLHINLLLLYFKLLRIKTIYPFSVGKNELPMFKGIYYNSLGGTCIEIKKELLNDAKTIEILKNVDYISVRERTTNDILKSKGIISFLVPDSAILMSSVFNRKHVEDLVQNTIKYNNNCNYIFFQIGLKYLANKADMYANILSRISKINNKRIVLCPIGTAYGHSDQTALEQIYSLMDKERCNLILNPSIWDIMWLIMHSSLYIGTSLHGTITSMSYGIPFVCHGPIKLKNYIETWTHEYKNNFVEPQMIVSKANEMLNKPCVINPIYQQKKVIESFNFIKSFI